MSVLTDVFFLFKALCAWIWVVITHILTCGGARAKAATAKAAKSSEFEVAIIGDTLGLCAAVRLKQLGIPFVVFERGDSVGGTWASNEYPGAACDVACRVYDLSFAPNDWPRVWAPQADTLRYLNTVAAKHGVTPSVRFCHTVTAAIWDDAVKKWTITARGPSGEVTLVVNAVIAAVGQLSKPKYPKGLTTPEERRVFNGQIFHTAEWPREANLAGKSVVVAGTGPSAVQIIPEIAKVARKLTVIQRSPTHFVPKVDYAYPRLLRFLFNAVPVVRMAFRAVLFLQNEMLYWLAFHPRVKVSPILATTQKLLRDQIPADSPRNKRLIQLLTPEHKLGCKRVGLSSTFYPTFLQPNVELVPGYITSLTRTGVHVESHGVQGAEVREQDIDADVIVLATGFQSQQFCAGIDIRGVTGRPLADTWANEPFAYYGMLVPDFPNFFITYGPNTNLGHNSIIFMIECQVNYICNLLSRLLATGASSVSVKSEAVRAFDARIQSQLKDTPWTAGCQSWYLSASGRVVNNWPSSCISYWYETLTPMWSSFEFTPSPPSK